MTKRDVLKLLEPFVNNQFIRVLGDGEHDIKVEPLKICGMPVFLCPDLQPSEFTIGRIAGPGKERQKS